MKQLILYFFLIITLCSSVNAQLSGVKMVGKNSGNSTLGFGTFWYWKFPLNEIGNRNFMLELMDLSIFPRKDNDINSVVAYLSIKAGYMYIFSEETKTGFYIEPSAGYCRVVNSPDADKEYGDGVAVALEAGYTLEVGQRGRSWTFGLKYERDMAGDPTTVSSIGLRVSYSFRLFGGRKNDY